MHFKPFWMPCLHIRFFTSNPIPELTAVENFTKRWNGILGSLVGFQKSIQIKKSSYQTWLESIDQKCGEKSAYRITKSCFRKEPSLQNFVFLCCCSSEFLSEIRFICYRIDFFWKIFLSDKLALTDVVNVVQYLELPNIRSIYNAPFEIICWIWFMAYVINIKIHHNRTSFRNVHVSTLFKALRAIYSRFIEVTESYIRGR